MLRDYLYNTKKIAVIGNSGGGKTNLCKLLSLALDLPLHHLDFLLWNPNWVPTPKSEFIAIHNNLIKQDRWIIDGLASWESTKERLSAADTIIYVDFPLWIHYYWATKRQFKSIFRPRPDFPKDCPMLPMTYRLYKMVWNIHFNIRPNLLNLLESHKTDKKIIHIRSPKILNNFMSSIYDLHHQHGHSS